MYNLEKRFLAAEHRLRPGGNFKKTSITVHSTGNANSTALNERKWLDNPSNNRDAAWHYIVGEGLVIQAIPDSEEAWHCGKKEGNIRSIGIEIIETGNRRLVCETAAEFVADKLKEHGLSLKDLKYHVDWSGKICPRIFLDKLYVKDGIDSEYFKNLVKKYFEKVVPSVAPIKINGKVYQMERIFVNDTNYIKIRDFAKAGFKVSYEKDMAVLETPER